MRRIASHYIYWRKWYRMHYLELDAEIANTEFYDGTLLPVPSDITFPPVGVSSLAEWLAVTDSVTIDSLVQVCHLPRISPTTPELGADYSSGDCYVQRL